MTDLRAALEASAQGHGPGLFGLVTDGGEVVFAGAVGVADPAGPRPMTADDQVRVASITKTYVAALVLQLAADGLLGLADTVEEWVPGGEAISVELLLRMRSGCRTTSARCTATTRCGRWRATGRRRRWSASRWPSRTGCRPHARGHLRSGPPEPYVECTTVSPSDGFTAGALVTTPRELARFYDALLGGRSTAGRCVVLTQNGIDSAAPLLSTTPFIQAAPSR